MLPSSSRKVTFASDVVNSNNNISTHRSNNTITTKNNNTNDTMNTTAFLSKKNNMVENPFVSSETSIDSKNQALTNVANSYSDPLSFSRSSHHSSKVSSRLLDIDSILRMDDDDDDDDDHKIDNDISNSNEDIRNEETLKETNHDDKNSGLGRNYDSKVNINNVTNKSVFNNTTNENNIESINHVKNIYSNNHLQRDSYSSSQQKNDDYGITTPSFIPSTNSRMEKNEDDKLLMTRTSTGFDARKLSKEDTNMNMSDGSKHDKMNSISTRTKNKDDITISTDPLSSGDSINIGTMKSMSLGSEPFNHRDLHKNHNLSEQGSYSSTKTNGSQMLLGEQREEIKSKYEDNIIIVARDENIEAKFDDLQDTMDKVLLSIDSINSFKTQLVAAQKAWDGLVAGKSDEISSRMEQNAIKMYEQFHKDTSKLLKDVIDGMEQSIEKIKSPYVEEKERLYQESMRQQDRERDIKISKTELHESRRKLEEEKTLFYIEKQKLEDDMNLRRRQHESECSLFRKEQEVFIQKMLQMREEMESERHEMKAERNKLHEERQQLSLEKEKMKNIEEIMKHQSEESDSQRQTLITLKKRNEEESEKLQSMAYQLSSLSDILIQKSKQADFHLEEAKAMKQNAENLKHEVMNQMDILSAEKLTFETKVEELGNIRMEIVKQRVSYLKNRTNYNHNTMRI